MLMMALAPSPGRAEAARNGARRIPRAETPIVVDGVLEEDAWRHAWSEELRYEVRPGENTPAPVRTEVLVTYDDEAVYFGFRAHDPDPDRIQARLSRRGYIGSDDWVAVILDTFNDERRAFTLVSNPLGVQADLIETDSGNISWDGIWASAGRLTEWGYEVEMRVPFSTLRFQSTNGHQVWGFDAVRSLPRSVRHQIGMFPRDRNLNCYYCQMVKIEGFDGVAPGRNLEVTPTVTAGRTDARVPFPGGGMAAGSAETEAGVTVRWGMTPNLTLSGTLNPDFSQVEADALQLDLNEPFALFLPEKRPFFQEGSDFFATPINAVYSRTIRDPAWGAKLTGKENGHTIGAFVVRDEATNLLVPGSRFSRGTTIPGSSTAGALRFRHDLGRRATLGVLATAREGLDYHNRVAGVDGDLLVSPNDRIRLQFLGSVTRYPDGVAGAFGQPEGELQDWAGEVRYHRDTRNVDMWALVRVLGKDFRADLGFLPQVDARRAEVGGRYSWIPNGARTWYSALSLSGMVRAEETVGGELLARDAVVQFAYEGPMQSQSVVRVLHRREGFSGLVFDRTELFVHHGMKPGPNTHIFTNLTFGEQIDYASARLGRRVRINPRVNQRFGRHLTVDLGGAWERLADGSTELYTATIAEAGAVYQFNIRTFLRAMLQYADYDSNPMVDRGLDDPRSRRVLSQVLFSYTINPQTVAYLGYSDASIGGSMMTITRAQRTFFVKFGYALLL